MGDSGQSLASNFIPQSISHSRSLLQQLTSIFFESLKYYRNVEASTLPCHRASIYTFRFSHMYNSDPAEGLVSNQNLRQTHPPTNSHYRTTLTETEKASYLQAELCLMDPAQAPALTGYKGSKSRWDELQAVHVA